MANYFSLILVLLTLTTGLVWLVDSMVFAPKRKARLQESAKAEGANFAGEHSFRTWLIPRSKYSQLSLLYWCCARLFTNHFKYHRAR